VTGRLILCLNVSVAPDVPDDGSPLAQGSPDEEPAVTSGWVFLAAKQGDPADPDLLLQPMYTIEEPSRSLDPRVVYPALHVVELLPLGPSSQLQTEEQVLDPVPRQDGFNVFGVEARRVPGVRTRTDVHHNLDPVPLQQADELLCRMVGVSDREDRPPPGGVAVPGYRFPPLR